MDKNNFAYIDGANLHKGIADLGWKLDYKRFRLWLNNKYQIKRAYLFLGLVPRYKDRYTHLQEVGFTLVFKETVYGEDGKVKGNCDADLVLQVTRDSYENKFDKAVLVSNDGDYSSLAQFLKEKEAFRSVISPSNKCSFLLRKLNISITYLSSQKNRLKL